MELVGCPERMNWNEQQAMEIVRTSSLHMYWFSACGIDTVHDFAIEVKHHES